MIEQRIRAHKQTQTINKGLIQLAINKISKIQIFLKLSYINQIFFAKKDFQMLLRCYRIRS
ncbi:unnamed protein product [Paramecium pentaurelia]|uniref:Uncharacterized protein n=1 Tax=Paramecium pentaurelia TaxID=43138 RepID=A0A8S1VQC5_9CILI|nr:unnamed protein product [Paramecium pentaurelia]